MFHVPPMGLDGPQADPVHWTIVCLTPPGFWSSRSAYTVCEAPTLRAQSAVYVAKALTVVVSRWREVLGAVDTVAGGGGNVLQQPDHLQDILFDDDAFSTSKRYFWTINLIHDSLRLLDDSMKQWAHYRRWCVTPFKAGSETGRVEYWFRKSQAVLAAAELEGEEAYAELKLLLQEFQDRLSRITVMRDGVSSVSPLTRRCMHSLTNAAFQR